ncbi:MAG: ATP-binding protein, partial [Pseudomonadota bacterium]
ITLASGNNMIVVLTEQRLFRDAREWLDRLKPVVDKADEQNLHAFFVQSMRLHDIQITGLLGDQAAAIVAFADFIDKHEGSAPVIVGSAWEFLAGARLEVGDMIGARDAAANAVELLASSPLESADARLVLAQAQLAMGQFDEADRTLRLAAEAPLLPPIRREKLLQLRLELDLKRAGNDELADRLRALIDAQDARERRSVEQNARYFDAKRQAQTKERELARVNASRRVLEAEAGINAARANEATARADAARQRQSATMIIVLLGAALGALLIVALVQRRYQQRLNEQERELNEQLSLQIEEQTRALKQQMESQTELERALADKARTEALGKLTGNVAHDFNNLLQVLSIAFENLAEVQLPEFQRSLISGADRALSAAKSIIRQLLAYARRQDLEMEIIDVANYLDESESLLRAAVDDQILFAVQNQVADACILVDRSQLTTALLSLLRNAVDAMPDGGRIELTVTVEMVGDNEWVRMAVTDTGIGMTVEQVAQACEPFFTTKNEDSGTGLGLSSVQGFVSQSGGRVNIDSAPGAGTTVVMEFPASEETSESQTSESVKRQGLMGLRVLLVEDNEILAAALRSMILHLGAKVEHIASADAATECLMGPQQYDLVISDIRMPGKLDGRALARWIREQRFATPVLLMSGYAESVDDDDTAVMTKPFSQDDLLAHVQSLVRMDQPRV